MSSITRGYLLDDNALQTARIGAMRAVQMLPSALKWAKDALQKNCSKSIQWSDAIKRINGKELDRIGHAVLKRTATLLLAPMPKPEKDDEVEQGTRAPFFIEEEIVKEAKRIGAHPMLWNSLSAHLRNTLFDERVNGKALGEHAAGDLFRD